MNEGAPMVVTNNLRVSPSALGLQRRDPKMSTAQCAPLFFMWSTTSQAVVAENQKFGYFLVSLLLAEVFPNNNG